MPEVRDYFPDVEKLDLAALHTRREALMQSCAGKYTELVDEALAELLAISRALRKKAAAPGTGGRKKQPKEKASIESFA